MIYLNIVLIILLYNSIVGKYNNKNTFCCGILGFSGTSNFNEDKIKTLMLFNQARGKDSLGYYVPNNEIYKELGIVEDILSSKEFNIPASNLFIGHIRAATVGSKDELKNAHPFQHGNIVLAMNGTLSNHWDLCKEDGFSITNFDVDSDVLTAMLNKAQSKEPLSRIIGGCAVLYTDTNTGILYAYRNSERPLYRGKIGDNMYLSSIDKSLKYIGCTDVKELKQDILYAIKEGKVVNNYKVTKVEPKKIEPVVNNEVVISNLKEYRNGKSWNIIRYNFIENKSLIGYWLTPNTTISDSRGCLTKGYGYEVIDCDHDNSYDIKVRDNLGKIITITKYLFDNRYPDIDSGSYMFALSKLTYIEKGGGTICEVGDLFKVTSVLKDIYDCTNLVNGKSCTAGFKYFRPAYEAEVDEYLAIYPTIESNIKDDNIINNNLKSNLNFMNQIDSSIHNNDSELSDFTIENIIDVVDDIRELSNDSSVLKLLGKIDIIINNYTIKKESINA